jgi:hypothetical protein
MKVVLTKLTSERHRLEVLGQSVELETRSFLVHDFVHFAVERAAGLKRGFYGSLAAGVPLSELNDREKKWPEGSELALAESVVGPMQSLVQGRLEPQLFLEHVKAPFVDLEFIARVQQHFDALRGEWKATPWRGQMSLEWP